MELGIFLPIGIVSIQIIVFFFSLVTIEMRRQKGRPPARLLNLGFLSLSISLALLVIVPALIQWLRGARIESWTVALLVFVLPAALLIAQVAITLLIAKVRGI